MSGVGISHGERVWVRRYTPGTSRDPYGKRTATYSNPVPIDGVGVDVPVTEEPEDGLVQRATSTLTLYLPPGTAYDSKDHFIVRGHEYEVEGVAEPLTNMFSGYAFNTEVTVRRTDG